MSKPLLNRLLIMSTDSELLRKQIFIQKRTILIPIYHFSFKKVCKVGYQVLWCEYPTLYISNE